MRRYKIIKRESKTGINLRIKPESHQHPFGFEELWGAINCENIEQATALLKESVKKGLERNRFGW